MNNLLIVLLGWCLGILSPRLIDHIYKYYCKSETQKSISIELDELKYKLHLVVYDIADHFGKIDRSFLEGFVNNISTYHGLYKDDKVNEKVSSLLSLKDDQLAAKLKQDQQKLRAAYFKKYTLPFLETHLSSITFFPLEFQRNISDIRAQLNMLNEEIDVSWYFNMRTFDTSDTNYVIVLGNVESSYKYIESKSRQLINSINSFMQEYRYRVKKGSHLNS